MTKQTHRSFRTFINRIYTKITTCHRIDLWGGFFDDVDLKAKPCGNENFTVPQIATDIDKEMLRARRFGKVATTSSVYSLQCAVEISSSHRTNCFFEKDVRISRDLYGYNHKLAATKCLAYQVWKWTRRTSCGLAKKKSWWQRFTF